MSFRPAQRSQAKPLIGIYSESGCGKTLSALLLARGFVGPNGKIGMIETEAGRGEAYVGEQRVGDYLARPIRGNFAPAEYGKAITEAEAAKLDALIIDSASHEWEGAGGVLSMAADNQQKGLKGVLVWQQPKMEHQRHFMLRLMQTAIPLVIVCMRAKYPMEEVPKPGGGKEWRRSENLEPKQAEDILFEMFIHGWIDREHKFRGTKYTLDSLRKVIIDGEPISLDTGRRLAEWALDRQPQTSAAYVGGQPTTPSSQDEPTKAEAVATKAASVDTEAAYQSILAKIQHCQTGNAIKTMFATDKEVAALKAADLELYEQLRLKGVERIQDLRKAQAA